MTTTVVPYTNENIDVVTESQSQTDRQERRHVPHLTPNALRLLKARYLLKDAKGRVLETPSAMFLRVARAIAQVESKYNSDSDLERRMKNEFYELMAFGNFLPNSPLLMNAGLENSQLSACYVIPVEDDPSEIVETCRTSVLIQQSGGGTGFSLSPLASRTHAIGKSLSNAPGPLSVMKLLDAATEIVKHTGKRRGANMGVLDISHPDIIEFITSKDRNQCFPNFTISVAVPDRFFLAVDRDEDFELVDPVTKIVVDKLSARDVFDLIAKMAWKNGDPGMVFIDEINRCSSVPQLGRIEATNPCGEQPLLPYESCSLGSINLSKILIDSQVDWEKLRAVIHSAVHFLDNSIDAE